MQLRRSFARTQPSWRRILFTLATAPLLSASSRLSIRGASAAASLPSARFCSPLLQPPSFSSAFSTMSTHRIQAKAIRVHQVGGPDQLQLDDIILPALTPSQVLVELHVVGVNYIDTYHRSGLYKLPLPAQIGREGAGVVVDIGSEVTNVSVGDRVVFFSGGAYATHLAVESSAVVKMGEGLSFREAAASHLQGLTAHSLSTSVYPVKKGDTVLVHAAAGGTGNILLQMCKIKGATVIGTVGSADKAELAREAGADHVINYNEQDFQTEVLNITGGVGVDVVFDGVGQATWEGSLKSLRKRGMMVSFGNASGAVPAIEPLTLTGHGSIFLARPSLAHFIESREELEQRVADLHRWLASKQIKLRIAKEFPLEQARQAHEAIESRQFAGKVLLTVKE